MIKFHKSAKNIIIGNDKTQFLDGKAGYCSVFVVDKEVEWQKTYSVVDKTTVVNQKYILKSDNKNT